MDRDDATVPGLVHIYKVSVVLCALECGRSPRRGRRVSVGEDVPSLNGGDRLGHGDDMDEFPSGVDEENDDSPLEEEDLPPSSYTERVTVGKEDTVIVGAGVPLMEVVAKRCVNRTVEYLVLTSTFETHWLPRSALMLEYASLVTAFEQSERKKNRLPALRRGARLAEANAEVDEEYVLLA